MSDPLYERLISWILVVIGEELSSLCMGVESADAGVEIICTILEKH